MRSWCLATIILAACSAAAPRSACVAPADALGGTWEARLTVEVPPRNGLPARGNELRGTIALHPATGDASGWLGIAAATHAGTHSLAVDSLEVQVDAGQAWRAAGARREGADSVLIVLNPAPDHGGVVLQGTLRDDRIIGHWSVSGYVRGASGTFEMRRRE